MLEEWDLGAYGDEEPLVDGGVDWGGGEVVALGDAGGSGLVDTVGAVSHCHVQPEVSNKSYRNIRDKGVVK